MKIIYHLHWFKIEKLEFLPFFLNPGYIQYAHNIEASNEYCLLNQIDVSVSRNDAIYVRCIVRIQWKSLLSTFLHSMVMLKHCIKHSDCLVI